MTVIVLAGGRGRRMRADKAGLAVGGTTLLGHVLDQVAPRFDEVLVSAAPGQELPPLPCPPGPGTSRAGGPSRGWRVVFDTRPGLGPIGGLLAGLRAARNEACAVVACDIPEIDLPLLRALAQAASRSQIAVPVGPRGRYEPLFAVYRRSVIPEIESLLRSGERSLLPLFGSCRTALVPFAEAGRVPNLNTLEDYEAYLRSVGGRLAAESKTSALRQNGKRRKQAGRSRAGG
jgi:molybdopterin-guanine dinucleotide biosynthesis protein A